MYIKGGRGGGGGGGEDYQYTYVHYNTVQHCFHTYTHSLSASSHTNSLCSNASIFLFIHTQCSQSEHRAHNPALSVHTSTHSLTQHSCYIFLSQYFTCCSRFPPPSPPPPPPRPQFYTNIHLCIICVCSLADMSKYSLLLIPVAHNDRFIQKYSSKKEKNHPLPTL